MDMSEGNDDHSSYPSSSLTPDWQFSQQIDPPTIGNSMSSIPMGWNQGLIERAARFSCFNGGSFGPLESAYPSASQSPMNTDQSPRDSGEAEASGDGDDNSCSRANSAKKRKGIAQEMELDDAKEKLQKVDQKSTSAKGSGTDGAKGDYIHVRARRGQATNSHSLAERVRREKISERMKFLQDLVPGCSKVTGKAVMLDEIINYVQSLQRQVEFLSMKLAAVNPRLDFNIGLLSKDLLHLRGGSLAAGNFLPEVIRPQLQHGFAHSGIPGIGNTSDAHRRAMNAQLASANGFKEHLHQMPNAWDEELNNVVQMNFVANPSFDTQELNTKPGEGFPL